MKLQRKYTFVAFFSTRMLIPAYIYDQIPWTMLTVNIDLLQYQKSLLYLV